MRDLTPRLLTEDQAAAYLNMPVATVVREGVGRVRFGRFTRYDRCALDAHLDALSGLSAHVANDSADAAFDRSIQYDAHRPS